MLMSTIRSKIFPLRKRTTPVLVAASTHKETVPSFEPASQTQINLLPFELLSNIFLLCIDADSGTYVQDAYTVSHVCTHWRNVAINTPQIWTGPITVSVHPYFIREAEEERPVYAEGLRAWLARSEPLSISMSLEGFRMGMWSPKTKTSSRITQELAQTTSRWHSLRTRHSVLTSLIKTLAEGGPFTSLEELELEDMVETDGQNTDVAASVSFLNAPRLHKLTINMVCRIPMPWTQLSHLNLHALGHSYSAILDILGSCSGLVHTSIVLSALHSPPAVRATPGPQLNRLESLSLTVAVRFGMWVMSFLDLVHAPDLESMAFLCRIKPALWGVSHLTDFQSRSPNITNLVVGWNGSPLPCADLISILTHSPHLTNLTLDDCFFDNEFLRALTVKGDAVSSSLAPRLSSLTLTGLPEAGFSEEILKEMLESRWASGDSDVDMGSSRRLQTVVLGGEFVFSTAFRDAMKELQASTDFPSSIKILEQYTS
ncbi:F-box domain-containing protein [Favolaschia claudopus]|uniref:F-box domain-containing protein n=1 Tax=Favolaschia claudopus TaxID=2862362 RepID=A0AAW0B6D7_9AGAR